MQDFFFIKAKSKVHLCCIVCTWNIVYTNNDGRLNQNENLNINERQKQFIGGPKTKKSFAFMVIIIAE